MTTLLFVAVALVGGFIFGVLFGRRNTQKVEKAVTVACDLIKKV
jgi:hypothetical protein